MSYSISYDDCSGDMFHKLFNYIDGQNDQGIKIAMTSPMMTVVVICFINFSITLMVKMIKELRLP